MNDVTTKTEEPRALVRVVQPALTAADVKGQVATLRDLRKHVLVDGVHCGKITGVKKPSLWDPGALILLKTYGLGCRHQLVEKTEDWEAGFFSYTYRACVFQLGVPDAVLFDLEGSCNSKEDKYRYRVTPQWKLPTDAAKRKALIESAVKVERRKANNEWQDFYYHENHEPWSQVNTIRKMAQKRARVGAVLVATGAAEEFTQDVEDMPPETFTDGQPEDGDRQPNGGNGRQGEPATPAQVATITNMLKSHVFTDAERKLYHDTLAGASKAKASQLFERVKAELETRKKTPADAKPEGPTLPDPTTGADATASGSTESSSGPETPGSEASGQTKAREKRETRAERDERLEAKRVDDDEEKERLAVIIEELLQDEAVPEFDRRNVTSLYEGMRKTWDGQDVGDVVLLVKKLREFVPETTQVNDDASAG